MRQRQFSRGLCVTCLFVKRMLVRVVVAGFKNSTNNELYEIQLGIRGSSSPLACTDLKSIARTSQTMAARDRNLSPSPGPAHRSSCTSYAVVSLLSEFQLSNTVHLSTRWQQKQQKQQFYFGINVNFLVTSILWHDTIPFTDDF